MSVKTKIARKAVRTTARHSKKGAVSKLRRDPVRSGTLIALGVAVGFVLGKLLGGRATDTA